jgi:hypothetical protein
VLRLFGSSEQRPRDADRFRLRRVRIDEESGNAGNTRPSNLRALFEADRDHAGASELRLFEGLERQSSKVWVLQVASSGVGENFERVFDTRVCKPQHDESKWARVGAQPYVIDVKM